MAVIEETQSGSGLSGSNVRHIRLLSSIVVVFLLYGCLTVGFFHAYIENINGSLIGPPEDNLQDLWNTWYFALHVHSLPDLIFTRLIRFPEGTELFYHSFAFPKMLLVWLLGPMSVATTGRLLTSENLLLLGSFPLSAVGAFLFVRHFTKENVGAFVGGAVFAFSAWHVEQTLHHLGVASIEFIPFFALSFMLANERKSVLFLCVSILFYVCSALSCWYYLFYCGYFMVFCIAFWAVCDRKWPGWWQVGGLAAHGAVLALVASPVLVPMIATALSGQSVDVPGGTDFGADLVNYVSFPPHHLLSALTAGLRWRLQGNPWEDAVYLGLVNLVLVGWFLLRRHAAPSRVKLFVLAGLLVFAVFASGDWLILFGHKLLPMPDLLLSRLPLFSNVRTPERAILFIDLFMSVGTGFALAAAWRASRCWRGRAVFAGLLAILLLDLAPSGLEATPFACPAGYRVIAADTSPGFGVLDLPIDQYRDRDAEMALQYCHGRPIVSGYVARELTPTLRDKLIVNDTAAHRQQLVDARVKYIVIHPQQGVQYRWLNEKEAPLASYLATYPAVYTGPDSTVLQVYP